MRILFMLTDLHSKVYIKIAAVRQIDSKRALGMESPERCREWFRVWG